MKNLYSYLTAAFTLAGMLLFSSSNGQSIRKNYREMTLGEKNTYCAALDVLKANGTIASLATMHNNNFTPIHNRPMFLPWHRYFSYDFEQMLRNTGVPGASNICIPYWDWTSEFYPSPAFIPDNSKSAPLWIDPNFIGKYNSLWSLGRSISGSNLTFGVTIDQVMNLVPFGDYSNTNTNFAPSLEYNLHNSPHGWVGGIMSGGSSPSDPVFFLHHNMVDKIWNDWYNLGGGRVATPFYNYGTTTHATSMPTYPTVNPYSIVNSRALKVWYAENNQVILNSYTSSGTERYRYTGTIDASTFTVAASTNVEMVSASTIIFRPGFTVQANSNFTARIDAPSFAREAVDTDAEEDPKLFAATEFMNFEESNLWVFPNPSTSLFNVSLITNLDVNYSYKIFNSVGEVVKISGTGYERQFEIDLGDQPAGLYVMQIIVNDKLYHKTLILAN